MKIKIKLKDNREIETEIDEKDYEELKKELIEGKIKFLNFENRLLKTSLIEEIEPITDLISKEFRLPEPKFEEERIKVPGGWQKPSIRKEMIRLFNRLKANGLFKEFDTYEDWEFAKYGERFEEKCQKE